MINDELNWQKILEIGASSLGSSIGTAIISEMFPSEDSAQEAVKQAVEEIFDRDLYNAQGEKIAYLFQV